MKVTSNMATQVYQPLIENPGLPKGYIAHGTFVIEYPAERYLRIPVRKPVDVKWHLVIGVIKN